MRDARISCIENREVESSAWNEDLMRVKCKECSCKDKAFSSIVNDAVLQIDTIKLTGTCYEITLSLQ